MKLATKVVIGIVAVVVTVAVVILINYSRNNRVNEEPEETNTEGVSEGTYETSEGQVQSTNITLEEFLQREISDTEPVTCCALAKFHDKIAPYREAFAITEDSLTKAIKARISNWSYRRQFQLYNAWQTFSGNGMKCPESCPEA